MSNISSVRIIQGVGGVINFTLSAGVFQGTESLTAVVSTGSTAASVLTLTPAWTAGQTTGAYQLCYVTYTAANSAALSPGFYTIAISLTDTTAALAYALLEVVAGAGQTPTYDWLVQPAEVMGLVSDVQDITKLADLPRLCGAATGLIRSYCNRWFTRRIVTKEFMPSYTGQVMLSEIPVNQVIRIATGRTNALQITGPTSAQVASVYYATTGDYGLGQAVTGLVLYSIASGFSSTTTITFSANQTLASLVTAINAVSGWKANAGTYGAWAVTELVGGEASQSAVTSDGAWLDVYATGATLERLDQETGLLRLTRSGGSTIDTPAWGPDWLAWQDGRQYPNRVKITYDAGYTVLPDQVVSAASDIIQAMLASYASDNAILSEAADGYSYTYKQLIDAIPPIARQKLSAYRLVNA